MKEVDGGRAERGCHRQRSEDEKRKGTEQKKEEEAAKSEVEEHIHFRRRREQLNIIRYEGFHFVIN